MSPASFGLRQLGGVFAIGMLAAAALVVVATCGGCGAATPQDIAQTALTATARGVSATDEVVAERYTEASREALDAVESMDAFREAMQPLDRAESALRGARTTLLAAQAGLDIWVSTGSNATFLRVVKCLAGELDALVIAVEASGLTVPTVLRDALSIGAAYGKRLCREGGAS